ncbi:MAG: AAA family ATPase [Patescibacteria group bacterium]
MKLRNEIIAFEGAPGAGKTTAIQILAKKIFGKKAAVLPQVILSQYKNDDLFVSKRYLDAEIKKATRIRQLQKCYQYILLDRTFLATLAYSYARSRLEQNSQSHLELIKYFRQLDRVYKFPRPTHLFFLFVKTSRGLERRADYAKSKKFKRWFDPRFLKYFDGFYRRHIGFDMPRPIIIDTTNMTKERIVSAVLEYL